MPPRAHARARRHPDTRGKDLALRADDLAALSASTTLVLANSTFSYWGSYLASSFYDEHLAIAPSHHEIAADGSLISPMFDPAWPRTPFTALSR